MKFCDLIPRLFHKICNLFLKLFDKLMILFCDWNSRLISEIIWYNLLFISWNWGTNFTIFSNDQQKNLVDFFLTIHYEFLYCFHKIDWRISWYASVAVWEISFNFSRENDKIVIFVWRLSGILIFPLWMIIIYWDICLSSCRNSRCQNSRAASDFPNLRIFKISDRKNLQFFLVNDWQNCNIFSHDRMSKFTIFL